MSAFLVAGGLAADSAANAPKVGRIVVPAIFSENMVLQRDVPIPVWGWGPEGEEITVSIADENQDAKAMGRKVVVKDGVWEVTLPPLEAGGPYTLLITGSDVSDTVMFTQVLVGDVWLACGQSNMMMGVTDAEGAEEAAAERFDYPDIRMVQVGRRQAHQITGPQTTVEGYWGPAKWENATYGITRSNATSTPGCPSAVGYYFARELYKYLKGEVPVGIIQVCQLLPAISWVDDQTLAETPALAGYRGRGYPDSPSMAYASDIAPLAPFPIRGVIYYQGEMDGGQGERYRAALPALIRSWRKTWNNPELPFLFVQLAGFTDNQAPPNAQLDMDAGILAQFHKESAEHGFCGVREAQLMTAESVPFAGMASAVDLGDPYDIHPRRKREVAERLFLLARKIAYGEKDLVASGPVPAHIENKGDRFEVAFKNVGGGLVAKDGELTGFELSEDGKTFVGAQARIERDTVIVSSPEAKAPKALRYAWAGYPLCSLYNKEGLPASPFRHPVPGAGE
ncbi:MAG: sialate O-acetylesterase [Kiritimatiellia bacterium]